VAPDIELELGGTDNVEIDLDGTFFFIGPSDAPVFDGQSFWMNVKLGLWDGVPGWAVGLQIGPKLPVARGTSGVGYEGTVLVDRKIGEAGHLTINAGGLVDPGPGVGSPRPAGV